MITGLGVVSSAGAGREPFERWLASGDCLASAIDRSAGYHRRGGARHALLVGNLNLSTWVPPAVARRMSPPARYAVAAARLALEDAALPSDHPLLGQAAVVMATSFGPSSFTERLLTGMLQDGPEAASPALFTECVANAPAAQIGLSLTARGVNVTITQREAGALLAVVQAAREIELGRTPIALAGSSEEITPLLHALLDRFGALARPLAGEEVERARPFDRRRNGAIAAEGAVVLVLEDAAAAAARGARPLARFVAGGGGFDPSASVSGWGDSGVQLGAALVARMRSLGVDPERIGRWMSGANGSRPGDRAEAALAAARQSAGTVVPLLAPKGIVGEYGPGFLAAGIVAARGGAVASVDGFEADPGLGCQPQGSGGRPALVCMATTSAGGAAAWCVVEGA